MDETGKAKDEEGARLGTLMRMVEHAASMTQDARARSEQARDFYDGSQWTAEETAALKRRGQPPIVANRIKPKVDGMIGIEQRNRTDPRAFGRTPRDEEGADVATKALRFVADNNRFDQIKSRVFENFIIEGYGAAEVIVEEKRGQFEVAIQRVRWEELIFDPHSREHDFSDAAFIGIMKWMSLDQAMSVFGEIMGPGREGDVREILEAGMRAKEDGDTFDDRPLNEIGLRWANEKLKRIRVSQIYHLIGGVWHLSIFTSGGILFSEESPYVDDDGKPECAIKAATAFVDRENRRYGVVQNWISIQTEINKRRSKALHQLNSRQAVVPRGHFDSLKALKVELARPDGIVEVDPDVNGRTDTVLNILNNNDQIAGQFTLLQEAKAEIEQNGPNEAVLGGGGNSQSGRALLAQQQAGFSEMRPVYDSLRDWELRIYRSIWSRIQQFWTEPRFIRVTDDMQAPEFLQVNSPVLDPTTGAPAVDQRTGGPMVQNRLAEMDMDIIIDVTPDFVTVRQEQFEQLSQLAQAGIPIPPEVLIRASDLQDKAALIEALQGPADDPRAQQAQQVAQMLQLQAAQADVAGKQAKAARDSAEARKTAAEIAKVRAETAGEIADTAETVVETRMKGLPSQQSVDSVFRQ